MLAQNDRLRLLNFPSDMHQVVQQAIKDFGWEIQKITEEKHLKLCHEIKLNGYPWWTHGKEAVKSRMLIMKVFTTLLEHGFRKGLFSKFFVTNWDCEGTSVKECEQLSTYHARSMTKPQLF